MPTSRHGLRFAPCRPDFDTPLSSIATLILQSPLPSRPHSWLPSTNPTYFTSASLHFCSYPSSPPPFPFLPTHIICPYSCYIGMYCTIYVCYTGFATRDDVMPIQLPRMMLRYGPVTIAIRARFEYDSSTIQHPTRSYVLSSNNEHVNSFALL